jgi:hypothetical protein
MEIVDKFNIIKKIDLENRNYSSLIKNYLENYFESGVTIYHIEYISQIVTSNKITKSEINNIIDELTSNIIIQKKQIIRKEIKKSNFEINNLYQIINNFKIKIDDINHIFEINYSISDFINKILSEPFLITFLDSELGNLNLESDIKKLYTLIFKLSLSDGIWFLKIFSSALKNNIKTIDINIPVKYKLLYEIKSINEYLTEIKNIYGFIIFENNTHVKPICSILLDKIIESISICNLKEINILLNMVFPNLIIQNTEKQTISTALSHHINVNNINNLDHNNIIELLITCSRLDILEKYYCHIFNIESFSSSVLKYIHYNININYSNIIDLINILSTIEDKDIFIDKYNQLLIERILSENTNIKNEEIICNMLYKKFGNKVIFKTSKIISDYKFSLENLVHYKNVIPFQTITTSFSNWNINYNQGYLEINEENNKYFDSILLNYQTYYSKIYQNKRKLLWLPQYGEVEIIFNNVETLMLPIQVMILELFNNNTKLSENEIINQDFLKNYSNKVKLDLINSLIFGKILDKINNYLFLTSSNNISANFIEIYIKLNNNIESNFIDSSIEIAHNREDIIKCQINHFIKTEPKNKIELFNLISNNINQFKLNQSLYDKVIDIMIKNDYITINNDHIVKILY